MDLTINDENCVYIKVNCERSFAKELSDFFTFYVPGYKFMPAYRNKFWNGQIKLYNIYTQEIYAGLKDYVVKFANDRNYSIQDNTKPIGEEISVEQVAEFIKSLNLTVGGKQIEIHPHQLQSIHHSINTGRCLLVSPTGSGKSLIIYCLMRWYLNKLPKEKKILIPSLKIV